MIMSHLSNKAVLFVDDEPRALHGYRDSLRKEAYDILTAASGLLALTLLSKNHVDVVVSDDRMPGMSGAELLELVRRDYPHIVRIMLTGQASLETSMRAIKGGIYSLLSKPIAPAELSRVIAAALLLKNLAANGSH